MIRTTQPEDATETTGNTIADDRRRFVENIAWYSLAVLLLSLRAFVLLRVFANLFGAEGYGVFSQANITVQLLAPFLSLRLGMASVRFLAGERNRQRISRVWMTMLATVVAAALVWCATSVFFSAPFAALLFGDRSLQSYSLVVSLWAAVATVNFFLLSYFRTFRAIRTLSILNVAQSGTEMVAVIAVAALGGTVLVCLWTLVAVALAFMAIVFIVIRGQLTSPIRLDWRAMPGLLRYSVPLMPNGLMIWVVQFGARYVVVQVLGLAQAGIYSGSYTLANLLAILSGPITFVLFPTVSKSWADEEYEETRRYFAYSNKTFLFAALPAGLGLTVLSPTLLKVIARQEFVVDPRMFLLIVAAVIFAGLYQINLYSVHLVKKTERFFWVLSLAAAISFGLSILLVPWLGLYGAAAATATAYGVLAVITMVWCRRDIKFTPDHVFGAKCLFAALLMAGVVALIPGSGVWGLLPKVAAGIIVYLGLISLQRTFSAAEIHYFGSLVGALRARLSP